MDHMMKNVKRVITVIIVILLLLINIHLIIQRVSLAKNFIYINNTEQRTNAFVKYFIPIIRSVNTGYQETHQDIANLQYKYQRLGKLSHQDRQYMEYMFTDYYQFNPKNPKHWQILLNRTNRIPPSILLAKAIYQTNSGKSPMLAKTRNAFGVLCYKAGCGLQVTVSNNKQLYTNPQLTKCNTTEQCLVEYFYALARNPYYQDFRARIKKLRKKKQLTVYRLLGCGKNEKPLQSFPHAQQLCQIIRQYHLTKYDKMVN